MPKKKSEPEIIPAKWILAPGSGKGPDRVLVIATFDNDGTLWAEQPIYFQFAFAIDRVKAQAREHPEWRNSSEPVTSLLLPL
jgi:hypothetical protein